MAPFPLPTIYQPDDPTDPLVFVGIDLTIYPEGLTAAQIDAAIDVFRRHAPPGVWKAYQKVTDLVWNPLPAGKDYVHASLGDTSVFPFLPQMRDRFDKGWRSAVRIWDELDIAGWSLIIYQLPRIDGVNHGFVRVLMPHDTAPDTVWKMAVELGRHVPFLSGHAGFAFLYDAYHKESSFGHIYALARRYWAIDIEDMNRTIAWMRDGLKSIAWITLVGNSFIEKLTDEVFSALPPPAIVQRLSHGVAIRLADRPAIGDQNRPSPDLDGYFRLGKILEPVMLDECEQFAGPFAVYECTRDWIHRFAAPQDW